MAPSKSIRRQLVPCVLAAALAAPDLSAQAYLTFNPAGGDEDVSISYSDGMATALSGDIDGDGIADLLVDAPSGSCCGSGSDGVVFAWFGTPTWPATWDLDTRPADVTFGHAVERDALRLADIGDVNGDGVADVVVVATGADGPGGARPSSGEVWIWFGRSTWPAVVRPTLTVPDVTIHGDTATFTPRDARVGDGDGDGVGDLLVLGTGSTVPTSREAWIFRGRGSWPSVIDVATDAPDARITGLASSAAHPVFADVSGDGLADVGVGSTSGTPTAILILAESPWPATMDAAAAVDRTFSGVPHLFAGNLAGDATWDLVATEYSLTGPLPGRVRVFEGGPTVASAGPIATITGRSADVQLATASVGDADGDGAPDLLLAESGNGLRGRQTSRGAALVVRGPLGGMRDLSVAEPELVVQGASNQSRSVVTADVTGDSRPDLAVANWYGRRVGLLLGPVSYAATPRARDLHVDAAGGSDTADGLSWATAKATIAGALETLDRVPGRATVRVREGTYAENVSLGADTELVGGWYGAGGRRDPVAHPSVIDGRSAAIAVTLVAGSGSQGSRLEGFRIVGGRWYRGAGVYVANGTHAIVGNEVTNNTVTADLWSFPSSCDDGMGGMFFWNACEYPCSGYGSGILVEWGASADILNNHVHGNRIDASDGGFFCEPPPSFSCPAPYDCRWWDWGRGGAIRVDGAGSIRNNTVHLNDGEGVTAVAGTIIEDNIVRDQVPTLYGNRDFVVPAATTRNNVYGSSASPLDATNLAVDPLLVDPSAGDVHLSQVGSGQVVTSPAVDAGSVAASSRCLDAVTCLSTFTTRTDRMPDVGTLDAGYHYFIEPSNRPPVFAGVARATATARCSILVEWDDATDPEGDEPLTFAVYRGTAPGGEDFGSPLIVLPGDARSFEDDGAAFGPAWFYVVRATDARGAEDSNAAEVSATLVDPSQPTLVPATPSVSACRVSVAFAAADDCSRVATVELHRSATAGFSPSGATLVASGPVSPLAESVPTNGNWFYRLVARNGAGLEAVSDQLTVHVGGCDATPVRPGEAFIPLVRKVAGAVEVTIAPAAGAVEHRLYRGHLDSLPGYDHAVEVGPDRLEGTLDDVGACRAAAVAADRGGLQPGRFYWLAVGVDASGAEGPHGHDSFGRANADLTAGIVDCP